MEDIHSSPRRIARTVPANLFAGCSRPAIRSRKRLLMTLAALATVAPLCSGSAIATEPSEIARRTLRTPVAETHGESGAEDGGEPVRLQRLPELVNLDQIFPLVTEGNVARLPLDLDSDPGNEPAIDPKAGAIEPLANSQNSQRTFQPVVEPLTQPHLERQFAGRIPPNSVAADNSTSPEDPQSTETDIAAKAGNATPTAPAGIWNVYISNPQPVAAPAPIVPPAPISIYNIPQEKKLEVDAGELRRQRVAALVSDSILGDRSTKTQKFAIGPVSGSVTAVQLLRECEEKATAADGMLKRGAAFAAREEAVGAIRCFAAATDLQHGGRNATAALETALSAMREAGDFLGRYGNVDSDGIVRMVASHETEVLKNSDLQNLTPHAAADLYLDYARQNLTTAVSGEGQGARLLMLLANAERARKSDDGKVADAIAITCLRAAVGSNPSDPLIASELGFMALRSGQLGEARWALEHSLALQPSTPAMQNLAETYRLAGDTQRAREIVARLPSPEKAPARSMLVTTVSPSTFAQISPPVQSNNYAAMPAFAAPVNQQPQQIPQTGNYPGRAAAQGFHNVQQQPAMHALPAESGPSVLERMANAVKNPWR